MSIAAAAIEKQQIVAWFAVNKKLFYARRRSALKKLGLRKLTDMLANFITDKQLSLADYRHSFIFYDEP